MATIAVGNPIRNPVAQTRVCAEVLRSFLADKTLNNLPHYYTSCRPEINAFLEKHTSSASLDVCVRDLKDLCRIERFDSLDGLLLSLSFEELPIALVLYMSDLAEWTHAALILKANADTPYVVMFPSKGEAKDCTLLDYDVGEALRNGGEAKEGYLLFLLKPAKPVSKETETAKSVSKEKEEPKAPPPTPEHCPPPTPTPSAGGKAAPKKRPRKKGVVGDATSEESTTHK